MIAGKALFSPMIRIRALFFADLILLSLGFGASFVCCCVRPVMLKQSVLTPTAKERYARAGRGMEACKKTVHKGVKRRR